MYINEEEYNPFLVSSTGAKVIVHRQDEYPFIEDVGTEIETAMATSIGMHLVRGQSDFCRLSEKHRFFPGKPVRCGLWEGVGFKRQRGPVFSSGHPTGCPVVTKASLCIFCTSEQDRMPFGEEWKEPSLFQRQTPAIMDPVLDARHQTLTPYLPVMEIERVTPSFLDHLEAYEACEPLFKG